MRQISNHICVSRERFGEAIFFVENNTLEPDGEDPKKKNLFLTEIDSVQP